MNFFTYLDRQKLEDRQAFIIYYPAMRGKTRFAKRAQQLRPDLYYLDLLEYCLAFPKLPANSKEIIPWGASAVIKGALTNCMITIQIRVALNNDQKTAFRFSCGID